MPEWFDGLGVRELEQKLREDEDLLGQVTEHKRALEQILKTRRHTHATIDGIEHALSVIVRVIVREEIAAQMREADLRELRAVLGEVRQSPTAYREKNAGKRRPELHELVEEFLRTESSRA